MYPQDIIDAQHHCFQEFIGRQPFHSGKKTQTSTNTALCDQAHIQDLPKGDHGKCESIAGIPVESRAEEGRGKPPKLKAFCPFSYKRGQKLRIIKVIDC